MPPFTDATVGPLHPVVFNCETLSNVEPQALGFTYWFDTAPTGEPYSVSVSFDGRRIGVPRPGPRDRFGVRQTIDPVLPGSGPIAVTIRVGDVAPGEWQVTATPTGHPRRPSRGAGGRAAARSRPGRGSTKATTGFGPVIRMRAPGTRLGAWPTLVGLGVAVALAMQALLAAHTDLSVARVLAVSLAACLGGLVGAKLYYLALHPDELRGHVTVGGCLQGFVLATIAVLVAGALVEDIPTGRLLDTTTPGLLLAMAIGRLGCYFGGCCAGRPTASRWGVWSSNRHLGVRRMPTQLLESVIAATLGSAALAITLLVTPRPAGIVFVGAIAAYTLGRQLVLPLRDLPRRTPWGRAVVIVGAAIVVVTDITIAVLG